MPLQHVKYLGPSSILGIWHLTEEESYFLRSIDSLVSDRTNLESIHHSNRRKEWLAGRYLVMELAKIISLRFEGIWTDKYNKPHLVLDNASISLSHASPYVVAILDTEHLCGIDIERLRDKLLPLSPKFLNAPELEMANSNIEKLAVLWGAKEALYKLHGRKSLIFKDNLFIKEFKFENGLGKFKGVINIQDEHEEYRMFAGRFGDFVLVYTNGEI